VAGVVLRRSDVREGGRNGGARKQYQVHLEFLI
jgi:hypothetical protein